jgi:hypothetical protein
MEPIALAHRTDVVAYIARRVCAAHWPVPLPRGARSDRLREVWLVTSECAVRSTGLIDGTNARSQYRGEWDATGGRLSLARGAMSSDPMTLLLVFSPE